MRKLIQTIQNIWKIEDLKNRILMTLAFVAIYRFGCFVVIPGVDPSQLAALQAQSADGLLGLLNMFTGGAFSQASIFALGIMPYISASIVIQLLGMAIPYFQKLQKEGESGRRKINNITRYLTIVITGGQAPGYIANLKNTLPETAFLLGDSAFWLSSIIILVTGTLFVMWLGEKITDGGVGNGISLLIMIGIIAVLPSSLSSEFAMALNSQSGGLVMFLVEMVILVVVIGLCILLVQGTRRMYVGYHQGPEFAVTPGGAAIQKPEVRRAMQYAVDVEAICANLLNAPCTRMTGIVNPNNAHPTLEPYPYDPEIAEYLVQEKINTISITPDSIVKTINVIHNVENKK